MPFFGNSGYERNDRDYDRVVTDSRHRRDALNLALEIVRDKEQLGASELAELRTVLRNGLRD